MSNDICRICLGTKNLRNIFEGVEGDSLSKKIMRIADVQISEDDSISHFICKDCGEKVSGFIEFKELIESTDLYLQNLKYDEQVPDINSETKIKLELCDATTMEDDIFRGSAGTPDSSEFLENVDAVNVDAKGGDVHTLHRNKVDKTSKRKDFAHIQCTVCGKLFPSRFRLQSHMRTHTGERPFKCAECNRCFSVANHLKIHERTHTGEKPYECDICLKKFAQQGSLVCHMRLHTGDYPYRCHLCPKELRTRSHLKYHIRTHTGEKNFVCHTCGRAFTARSDLNQHEKTHTGEKPHVCTVCGKRLSRLYHLTRHMITHTRERNFKCEVCDAAFAQKYDLSRHKKIHERKKA